MGDLLQNWSHPTAQMAVPFGAEACAMTADEDQSRFDRSRFWTSAHEISIDVKAQHSVVEEWDMPEDKDTPSAWRDWVWRDEPNGHTVTRRCAF